MNSVEARDILLLYRPDTGDAEDPQIVEAMAEAHRDPELGRWFTQHCEFQRAMRAKFRQLEAPAHLKPAMLIPPNVIRPAVWWQDTRFLAAAAAIVFLLAVTGLWFKPRSPDRLAHFQERMVATALREYRMDIVTNDMSQVRQYLENKGGPANYEVTSGLAKLQLTGGGLLRWRTKPVSMVCFNRGDNQMLFLFVIDRSGVKDPPPEAPQLSTSHELVTASWTKGDKTYVLAGPQEDGFAQKYL